MKHVENKSLQYNSSLQIGGTATHYFEIESPEEIPLVCSFANQHRLPLTILGEGTNSIFQDTVLSHVFAKLVFTGIEVLYSDTESCTIKVAAGELWDTTVLWTVTHSLSGLEALSLIPGTSGAAPVQNIGAYGSELSDTCVHIDAYDRHTEHFVELSKEACQFSYRNSIFKENPERYIITHVTFTLHKKDPPIPQYKEVLLYFKDKPDPSLQEIRDAIIAIRSAKLPDYTTIPNVGSYFKNPIISEKHLTNIQTKFPTIPFFKTNTGDVKLYAGWILEILGYKGFTKHNITPYEKNALIITNQHHATFNDLQTFEKEVCTKVKKEFNILLEREPNIFK